MGWQCPDKPSTQSEALLDSYLLLKEQMVATPRRTFVQLKAVYSVVLIPGPMGSAHGQSCPHDGAVFEEYSKACAGASTLKVLVFTIKVFHGLELGYLWDCLSPVFFI